MKTILAICQRAITIHGWVFDVSTGKLIGLEIDFGKIPYEIEEIYRLEGRS